MTQKELLERAAKPFVLRLLIDIKFYEGKKQERFVCKSIREWCQWAEDEYLKTNNGFTFLMEAFNAIEKESMELKKLKKFSTDSWHRWSSGIKTVKGLLKEIELAENGGFQEVKQ